MRGTGAAKPKLQNLRDEDSGAVAKNPSGRCQSLAETHLFGRELTLPSTLQA